MCPNLPPTTASPDPEGAPGSRQRRSRESRDRLLRAAAAVMGRRGYEAASFREIAEEAGLSRGLLTFHFRSKRELQAAVGRWAGRHWARRFAEVFHARAGAGGRSTLDRFLAAHEEVVLENRELLRLTMHLRLEAAPEVDSLRELLAGVDRAVSEAAKIVVAEWGGVAVDDLGPSILARGEWLLTALRGLELRAATGAPEEDLRRTYEGLRHDVHRLMEIDPVGTAERREPA